MSFFTKRFAFGVLDANLAALALVGVAAISSECGHVSLEAQEKTIQDPNLPTSIFDQITRFSLNLLKLFGIYAGVISDNMFFKEHCVRIGPS